MALPKRRYPTPAPVNTKSKKALSAAEKRKQAIDLLYTRCRVCGFFMERKFPGDNICSSVCTMREMAEKELGEKIKTPLTSNENDPL